MKPSYVFTAFIRRRHDAPWEELCKSEDGDKGQAEEMCRKLAADLFADRLKKGYFAITGASVVTLRSNQGRPYGLGMRRRQL